MKVAFLSSEVFPFAKTGGLADVCGALPIALEKLGLEVCVFMPRYKNLNFTGRDIKQLNKALSMSTIGDNIPVYFIENDEFYHRDGLYGDADGDYQDNIERFKYFCLRSLDSLKHLNIKVDVLHCHDWHAALVPVYLKHRLQKEEFFKKTKSLFTIHNLAYQGVFPKEHFALLDLENSLYESLFEFYNQIDLMKAGILCCDGLSTVSPTYAEEIQNDRYGCGLETVILKRKKDLTGILNGVDIDVWDPRKDALISHPYSQDDLEGKAMNKAHLQKKSSLPIDADIPVFGFVGRLCHQKGLDLICETMDSLAGLDMQMVFLGVGEKKYEDVLSQKAKDYPGRIHVKIGFDEKWAHWIYAGSDFFLMPSIFEPCGLNQMISLRYGTLPVVYYTGGLADTVKPYDKEGNGFVFYMYENDAFLDTVKESLAVYQDKNIFQALVQKAFTYDFIWEDSAKRYLEVYQNLTAD